MSSLEIHSALDVVNFLESNNGRLLINLSPDAVGHVLSELDNFTCMRVVDEVPTDGIHFYLGPVEDRMQTIFKLYGDTLNIVSWLSPLASEISRSIALFRPDLTVDVGMSSKKIAPIKGKAETAKGYCHYVSTLENLMNDFVSYYQRKLETFSKVQAGHAFTMSGGELRQFTLSAELERLIDARGRRLALIQIKSSILHSGGAGAVDPSSYLATLAYLRDEGFQIVLVGREEFPDVFSQFDVIDYANSSLTSFENDFVLFSNSSFCLTGPSGIAMFPELMMKPYVVANTWWHGIPPFSPLAVAVPALAHLRDDGSLLTFDQQNALWPDNGVYFPKETHQSIAPDKADILAATIEALALGENLTMLNENQLQYRRLTPPAGISSLCNPYCLSRISGAYAERYQDLLSPA